MRFPVPSDTQTVSYLYLGWLIREQIDRATSLRDAIPDRQCHAALARLAEACKDVLDEQARQLGRAGALLGDDGDANAAGALRVVRRCTRAMGEIEGYAIPALHCQSDQAVFLNDVLSTMHCEVGLPPPCPTVACMSNGCVKSAVDRPRRPTSPWLTPKCTASDRVCMNECPFWPLQQASSADINRRLHTTLAGIQKIYDFGEGGEQGARRGRDGGAAAGRRACLRGSV